MATRLYPQHPPHCGGEALQQYELRRALVGPPRAKTRFVKFGPPGVDLMVGYVHRARRNQMAMLVVATSGHIYPVVSVRVALGGRQLGQVDGGCFLMYLHPHV